MISFSDIEFQRTKALIQGRVQIEPIAKELALWISNEFDVAVLNVIFDTIAPDDSPRIQVILESQEEVQIFWDEATYGNCEQKTSLIIKKLSQVLKIRNSKLNIEGTFVVFSAFAPLARQEAFSKISRDKLKQLKIKLNNAAIWEIPYQLGYPAIFVYTNRQLHSEAIHALKERSKMEFFALIKPYDELNYISIEQFHVSFDSKENFDSSYGANWFNYWHG